MNLEAEIGLLETEIPLEHEEEEEVLQVTKPKTKNLLKKLEINMLELRVF